MRLKGVKGTRLDIFAVEHIRPWPLNYFETSPLVSTACVASPSEGACMDGLNKAWRFLKNETNQKTLTFIGGGIAAVVIGGWQFYTHFAPSVFESNPLRPSRPAGAAWPAGKSSRDHPHPGPAPSSSAACTVFHRRTFKRSPAELGVTQAALASFFGHALGEAQGLPQDLDSTLRALRQKLQAARGGPEALHLRRPRGGGPQRTGACSLGGRRVRSGRAVIERSERKDLAAAERQESVARQRRLSRLPVPRPTTAL